LPMHLRLQDGHEEEHTLTLVHLGWEVYHRAVALMQQVGMIHRETHGVCVTERSRLALRKMEPEAQGAHKELLVPVVILQFEWSVLPVPLFLSG
jgi:hypothetical protein